MGQAEILIAGLLVAVAGLSALARRLSVPYPIVLVLGGALFGFVPGVPAVTLDPNVVLVVFLPPLVYAAAFFVNLADIRANMRGITLSSVGLVLATMMVVAVVAHQLVEGLSWGAAFALGAIVSPTDPLAGATIMRRLDFPRFLISAIEGEGLFNDATSLVAYRVAVAAVVAGSFSLLDAGAKFLLGALGGVAIGVAVGWVIATIRRRVQDVQTSITISLICRLHPCGCARRVGGARGGDDRHLHGHPRPEHHPRAHPPPGVLCLGRSRFHRQRQPIRPRRGFSCEPWSPAWVARRS